MRGTIRYGADQETRFFGMALLYPTLLAAVSDVARQRGAATSLGVYRLWRDSGYAFGALTIGIVADAWLRC